MNSTAFEAKDISKTNTRPLRIFHSTIAARHIARKGLDSRLINRRHLRHLERPILKIGEGDKRVRCKAGSNYKTVKLERKLSSEDESRLPSINNNDDLTTRRAEKMLDASQRAQTRMTGHRRSAD
jgi:hypothetical protein